MSSRELHRLCRPRKRPRFRPTLLRTGRTPCCPSLVLRWLVVHSPPLSQCRMCSSRSLCNISSSNSKFSSHNLFPTPNRSLRHPHHRSDQMYLLSSPIPKKCWRTLFLEGKSFGIQRLIPFLGCLLTLDNRTTSRSTNYSDTPRNNNQQQSAPSPPYSQNNDYRNYNQYEQGSDSSPRTRTIPHQNVPPPPPQPQQVQPPSPRRSMFEFTSPFDHLSGTSNLDHFSKPLNATKKKPVPTPPSNMPSSGEEAAWSPPGVDSKRQSVDNLLETLTRGQPLVSQLPQPPAYESYLSGADFGDMDQASNRAPLPPIPGTKPSAIPNRTSSPRDSSPKTLHRPQPRPVDNGINQTSFSSGLPYPPGTRIEKEGSPGLRGNKQLKPQQAPLPQPQVQPQPQPKYTNPKPANVNPK